MNVNIVAATTATLTACATIAAACSTASVASTVATVAMTILTLGLSATSVASVTAWISRDSEDAKSYFMTMGSHMKYAAAATFQCTAQALVQAVINGLARGVEVALRRKIAGPDVTQEAHIKQG